MGQNLWKNVSETKFACTWNAVSIVFLNINSSLKISEEFSSSFLKNINVISEIV